MTVHTDTQSARVLLDPDGQALDFTDINDLQLLARDQENNARVAALIGDAISLGAIPGFASDIELSKLTNGIVITATDIALTQAPGSGYGYAGGGARTLYVQAGIVHQVLATPFAGTGETVASFYFDGTQFETTAIGDATNPRIDLLEMKLEYVDSDSASRDFEDATSREDTSQATNTRRRVQCTLQIKQGTPAAAAAVHYPACTAGFVPLAAVWVPALHNAVHTPSNIRDMRWPIGNIRVVDTDAIQAYTPGGTPWTLNMSAQTIAGPSSGSADAYFRCPVVGKNARLVGIGVHARGDTSITTKLLRVTQDNASKTDTTLLDIGTSLTTVAADANYLTITAVEMMDLVAGLAIESQGIRAANTRIGTPIWCSGYSAGSARSRTNINDHEASYLALKVTSNGAVSHVGLVRWFIAEG